MKEFNILQYYTVIIFVVFSYLPLNAQVTIGSGLEPDADAILDLKEQVNGKSVKGLLLPRVALNSVTASYPLTKHVAGMIVYNTVLNTEISPGLYFNDGSKWVRMDLPEGVGGQVLSLSENLQPKWVTLNVPEIKDDNFILMSSSIYIYEGGADLSTNNGISATVLDYTFNNKWFKLGPSFTIKPKYKKNRLFITVQTTVQKSGTANGWVSYAGGIFVNNLLKSVNMGQLSYANTGSNTFETILLHMVVENLSVDNQEISIAVTRVSSSSNQTDISIGKPSPSVTNLNSFMARPSIYYQYYEDPTSQIY